MLKISENNGTEYIGLVTPTPAERIGISRNSGLCLQSLF